MTPRWDGFWGWTCGPKWNTPTSTTCTPDSGSEIPRLCLSAASGPRRGLRPSCNPRLTRERRILPARSGVRPTVPENAHAGWAPHRPTGWLQRKPPGRRNHRHPSSPAGRGRRRHGPAGIRADRQHAGRQPRRLALGSAARVETGWGVQMLDLQRQPRNPSKRRKFCLHWRRAVVHSSTFGFKYEKGKDRKRHTAGLGIHAPS